MSYIKAKIASFSNERKLLIVIGLHLLINIILGVIFFLDDYSIPNQILNSVNHLASIFVLFYWIYNKDKELKLPSKIEFSILLAFIVINLIPFGQGMEIDNNGFVPMWVQLPQTNFGIPNVYLHIYDSQIIESNLSNPLIHLDQLFFNLYLSTIVTILVVIIKSRYKIFK